MKSGSANPKSRIQNLKSKIAMGFYARYIFPHLLELTLGNPRMGKYRRRALEPAYGKTLEIGFGTGLNLLYYPETVSEISAIDPERMLQNRVAQRIAQSAIPVNFFQLDASGQLPFDAATFDCIVTTFTLCSIEYLEPAFAEMRRVLKPAGVYLFFEHGRSDDVRVAKRQDRYNPLQKIIGVGCNMNRPIDRLITEGGFAITDLERFLLPDSPRVLAEMYRGTARRA
jgi:ubiquinone/menaquinone biosynthesis C-methylase UbiE